MSQPTIAIRVPKPFYQRLKRAAAVTQRSVSDVLTSLLAVSLPLESELPAEWADELASMSWFSDEALRAATKPSFTPKQQQQLNELNDLADERPLTKAEQVKRTKLLAAYERAVLRRAQAFALLAQRGHHIPTYAELAHSA